ncbi:hypothetical protein AbraIFM66951_006952 [Aspergillus brasiliensis]|nr:hypothetical protein AbraIFM66951_006952 [Aspergillus brasiliensis]
MPCEKVYAAAAESTPTPNFPSFSLDSLEDYDDTNAVLKEKLGSIYTDVPGFDEAYFGAVEGLKEVAAVIFDKLREHDGLLYDDQIGWHDGLRMRKSNGRYILGRPRRPIPGSTAPRKLDTGFVQNQDMGRNQAHWSNMLILGKLQRSSEMDTAAKPWLDLGRCAREVFTSQDARRFVLGFTLCGPIMRLWSFDRVGAISSTAFNINKEGSRFVMSMLGFLRMDMSELGYDPSIITTSNGTRFIEIVRDGKPERLILEKLLRRSACVAGRATTCWRAHCEGDESEAPLVIKDSWQHPERKNEGVLLREATDKQVVNVARYYYHGTVQVQDKDDDTQGAVRKGLDLKQGRRYCWNSNTATLDFTAESPKSVPSTCNNTKRKRTSSHISPPGPPTKRICASSQAESEDDRNENRVHRRVVVRDYGVPIYKAKSCISMLNAVVQCIEGYESLHARQEYFAGMATCSSMRKETAILGQPF